MGGTVKKVVSNPLRLGADVMTFGTAELANKALGGRIYGGSSPNPNSASSYGPLNMYMDPAGDAQQINALGSNFATQDQALAQNQNSSLVNFGTNQSGQSNDFINQDAATRATNRTQLAQLLQDQAAQTFKQTLPGTAEDYNAGGLLNSTGYQQEVARQQAQLAAGVTNQLGMQGLQDSNYTQQLKLAALQQNQGYQAQGENALLGGMTNANTATQTAAQNALSRQFSLQDYARQANVAQQIGAQAAPQQSSGKGGTGALLSGVGSLAPLVGTLFGGPAGGAAGMAAGQMLNPNSQVANSPFGPVTYGMTRQGGGK